MKYAKNPVIDRFEGVNGQTEDPTIFLYDTVAGGIGLASRLFEEREELLRRARHLIESCECEEGCPGCIGPDASGDDEPEAARKRLVLGLLDAVGVSAIH